MPFDTIENTPSEALLVLYANGDQTAARTLTARLLPRVLAHAYRHLGNRAEAEDVAQEVMLRLWKVAPEWRQGQAKITTWLYQVTANLCIDRLRKARHVGLEDAPDPQDSRPAPDDMLQDEDRTTALQSALRRLPDRQRQAVVLRHLEELGNPEIAAIMEISVEAVESLVARGKRALAADLAGRRDALGYKE